jgi:pimeloyl-ACP methyl ester carboxylesterase
MNKSTKRGCRYWIKLLSVGLVGGLLLACIGIEVVYIVFMANPAPSPININPGDLGFDYEDITFDSSDNVQLSGWHISSNNGATTILLHGYGANRTELIRHVEILARHGYGVLIYDLRGHGQSGGKKRTYGWLDVRDVMAALDYLDRHDDVNMKRIGIFGFSVGGQIAIRAATETDLIQAVFTDDPGFVTIKDAPPPATTWERLMYTVNWLDYKGMQLWTGAKEPPGVVEVIKELSPRPLFLVASGGLGNRLMHHYYNLAEEPKTLWEILEASHGTSLSARPQEYEEKMVDFYESSLLK